MDFWIFITLLGNGEAYLFLIPLVYFMISRKLGWRILLLTVFSAIIMNTLKDFFQVPRPPKELWKIEVEGYSFPSGHAAGASSFWFYLALKLKKHIVYVISITLIILISVSRIVLGVHYIRDIIAGILLGTGIALGFYYLDKKTQRMRKKTKDESLLISTIFILLISPYLIFKIPLEGAVLLGFALAHILVHFLNIKEVKNMKRRSMNFILSAVIISLLFFSDNPIYFLFGGFISCLFPQILWHFIENRVKK